MHPETSILVCIGSLQEARVAVYRLKRTAVRRTASVRNTFPLVNI
jgi:hypothetical protein